MKKSGYLPFVVVLAIALLVRIAYNLTAGVGYVAMADAGQYERIALHLLSEHCFCDTANVPTLGRAPLWPTVIAVIYWIFGTNNITVRLFLSILGSLSCLIVYFFARDLFGKRLGLIAGLIAACYPGMFIYDGWLYSESLYTFCFLAFTYALYRFQISMQRRWIILSAIAFACSLLTRQSGLLTYAMLAFFVLVIIWKKLMPWRVALKGIGALALISCLVIIPWSIRNYVVSGYIVPVSTGSSTILAGSYNDTVFTNPMLGATGMWVLPNDAIPPIQYTQKCCNIWGEDPNQDAYATHWIETHIQSMPRLLAMHFINIWRPGTPDGLLPISQFPGRLSSRLISLALHLSAILIILLALVGMALTWRRKWRDFLTIYMAITVTVIQCIVFYGSPRFRAPIEPMLVILATGVLWFFLQLKSKAQPL